MAFGNWLDSQQVEQALAQVAGLDDPLAVATRLRKTLPPELAREAAGLHDLRSRARRRRLDGGLQFLTRKGLEQASAAAVARYRAQRIREAGPESTIWDATVGVGADSLALRAQGMRVVSSDLDGSVLACAASNLGALDEAPWVVRADALVSPVRAQVVLLDPDRRPAGDREGHTERWSPPLAEAVRVARAHGGACIKLPPGLDISHLPDLGPEPHSLQWISLGGEVKELALWMGTLAGSPGPLREALVLGQDGPKGSFSGEPEELEPMDPADLATLGWLAEPDPAVIGAGLVGPLARDQGLAPIGPRLAYLGGSTRPSSPLLRSWRVLGTSPLDPKRVRTLLAEHDVGPLTVKKRGHPDDAQKLAKRFSGPGRQRGLLAVARLERGHLALLLESPLPSP